MLDLVQIGIIAYRNPQTGEYLPPMPLYKPKTDAIVQALETRQKVFERLLADEYFNSVAQQKNQN